MEHDAIAGLDPAGVLAAAEAQVRARRAVEVEGMVLLLQWCDLHSGDPQAVPGAAPKSRGGDYLRRIGGEGTPQVADLCFEEMAWARAAGSIATEHDAADALDLRHRLPLLWAAVVELRVEPWVARKVARMARKLGRDRVGIVDAAVARVILKPPGEILRVAEAKVIEADPDLHRAKLEADAARTAVWLSRVRPGDVVDDLGEPATRRISAKLPGGVAVRCEENVEDLAEALFEHSETDEHGNRPSREECRVAAFTLLVAEPHKAAAFLTTHDTHPAQEPADKPVPVRPRRPRRPAQVVVHLSDLVLRGLVGGVARVEDYGPVLVQELAGLLEGREVVLQPLIDLNTLTTTDGYEHPTAVKQRTLLRTGGDVFPHSTSRGLQRLDHDHPTPYDPTGPPGQTGDHNDAPLTRRHHRAKTHLGYRNDQLTLGVYRWISPHGLARLVTPAGTRHIEIIRDPHHRPVGELYFDTPRIDYHPRN